MLEREEIERQIKQVETHLAWLRSLLDREAADETENNPGTGAISEKDAGQDAADSASEIEQAAHKFSEPSDAESVEPNEDEIEEETLSPELEAYFQHTKTSDLDQLKLGCAVFGIVLVAGVLFFFFGLPYLIK